MIAFHDPGSKRYDDESWTIESKGAFEIQGPEQKPPHAQGMCEIVGTGCALGQGQRNCFRGVRSYARMTVPSFEEHRLEDSGGRVPINYRQNITK